MTTKSNRDLCENFARLLTDGFYADNSIDPDEALRLTKSWRSEVWVAFREIRDRLLPVDADMRKKQKDG